MARGLVMMTFSLLVLLLAACERTTELGTEPTLRQLGWLGESSARTISAPDTVRAGVPFRASVYSWGSGTVGCNAPDGTSVELSNNVARIEVFVRVPKGESTCTNDLRRYEQQVTAIFRTPGIAVIRAVGAAESRGRSAAIDSTERSVVVVP